MTLQTIEGPHSRKGERKGKPVSSAFIPEGEGRATMTSEEGKKKRRPRLA